MVSTDPSVPLAGGEVVAIERGTLGWSARGKVPLRDERGEVTGSVSVGIPIGAVQALEQEFLLVLLATGALAMFVSLLAMVAWSRRLCRITHGLDLEEMADLLREHAAVLAGALDGVVAVDANGRVRLANQAALDYLGEVTVGEPAADAGLPAGVAEFLDAAPSTPAAGQLMVVNGRILLARRVRVERHNRDLGTVLVLTDRTDLDDLGRELEATRALTDALRAQAHEYTNRLHALSGMLHLGLVADAENYLAQLTGAEHRSQGVEDPYLSGLLAAKFAVASEQGVELRVAEATWVEGRLTTPLDAVTVVGNLIDNAIRAAARGRRRPAWVEVSLLSDRNDLVVHVVDSGEGVPPGSEDLVFADGWTTKDRDGKSHGIGLALARATARRHGGDVELAPPPEREAGRTDRGAGADQAEEVWGAVFIARLREVLRNAPSAVEASAAAGRVSR